MLLLDDDYRRSRQPLARALRLRGDEVVVMARVHDGRPLPDATEVIPWSLSRGSLNPVRELAALVEVVRAYRRLRPALVHHVSHKPVVYGGIASTLLGIPTVNTINGLGYLSMSSRRRDRALFAALLAALRLVLRRTASRTIFFNSDDRDRLIARGVVPAAAAVVVPGSGVDADRFRPAPEPALGPPLVVCAGRMLREKGAVEFRVAAEQLVARGIDARFALVGEPDPHNPGSISAAELRRWAAAGPVEWWGRRDDMPEVLARAAIVCVPSHGEGLPKVLLEAAATGRAIVTTDVPGCRAVVRDGVDGVLVPPRDPDALADALGSLLDAPDERRRLGRAARARVDAELTRDHVVARILAVYDQVVAARGMG